MGLSIWGVVALLLPSEETTSDTDDLGSNGELVDNPSLPTSSPGTSQQQMDVDDDDEPSQLMLASSSADDPCPEEKGLAWSPAREGDLLSTSLGGICLYRIDEEGASGEGSLKALSVFKGGHSGRQAMDVEFAGKCLLV